MLLRGIGGREAIVNQRRREFRFDECKMVLCDRGSREDGRKEGIGSRRQEEEEGGEELRIPRENEKG